MVNAIRWPMERRKTEEKPEGTKQKQQRATIGKGGRSFWEK